MDKLNIPSYILRKLFDEIIEEEMRFLKSENIKIHDEHKVDIETILYSAISTAFFMGEKRCQMLMENEEKNNEIMDSKLF